MTSRTSLPRSTRAVLGLSSLALAAVLTGCGGDESVERPDSDAVAEVTESTGDSVEVDLADASGDTIGTVTLSEVDGGTLVEAALSGLEPGFHGFHMHQVGVCESASADPEDPLSVGDFLSAGGHVAEEGEEHAGHTGDLTSLQAGDDGTATLQVVTDRFTLDDLRDGDGTAVMVHDGPDNFGNIPERYAPGGPDEETLSTGDSGDRFACGVITSS